MLETSVFIRALDPCTLRLRLFNASITGQSLNKAETATVLNQYEAVFKLNSFGELDANIQFETDDQTWSRNIKRAIISAFQLRPDAALRIAFSAEYECFNEELDVFVKCKKEDSARSQVVYETDILGKCRTTYSINPNYEYTAGKTFTLEKIKLFDSCVLKENLNENAFSFVSNTRSTVNIL